MTENPIRLLIVDDSALYRQMIRNVLREVPDVTIVGVARDGMDALRMMEELDPDLLTLDVQMPDMDGIQVLREINRRRLRSKAIMISSLTSQGAQVTTDALLEGAFDFILKPVGKDPADSRKRLYDALEEKIGAFRQTLASGRQRIRAIGAMPPRTILPQQKTTSSTVCRAVIIATSTGGPAALKQVLPTLPAELPVPVMVVQHMPPKYTRSLAHRLDEICPLQVAEAANGAAVKAGSVLIAPGGRQMKLNNRNERVQVQITDDDAEHGCRPSADYLIRSAIEIFRGQILVVIMTGMGRDGFEGCRLLKETDGSIFAQHPHGCVVYGMPKVVIDHGIADRVLPLGRIGPAIVAHVKRSSSA
jgi:two-component system chemotaxis response regulator CheB